jgi:hypothetical protein
MKRRAIAAVLSVGFMCLANAANAECAKDALTFNFSSIKVIEAYAILADFAGLKPEVDHSLQQSEPMKFVCVPWRVVAQDLADRHNLNLKIENGVMRVTRR